MFLFRRAVKISAISVAATYFYIVSAARSAWRTMKDRFWDGLDTAAEAATTGAHIGVLVSLMALGGYLPKEEQPNVATWKSSLYKRLNGARAFDRPVPLLLVRAPGRCVMCRMQLCSREPVRNSTRTHAVVVECKRGAGAASECCILGHQLHYGSMPSHHSRHHSNSMSTRCRCHHRVSTSTTSSTTRWRPCMRRPASSSHLWCGAGGSPPPPLLPTTRLPPAPPALRELQAARHMTTQLGYQAAGRHHARGNACLTEEPPATSARAVTFAVDGSAGSGGSDAGRIVDGVHYDSDDGVEISIAGAP